VILHDHESKILCPSYAESSIVLTCPIAFFLFVSGHCDGQDCFCPDSAREVFPIFNGPSS